MRILIATTHVPFIRAGAEFHSEGLRDALRRHGHEAEIVAVPFKWYPPETILDHMLACRLLDLSEVSGSRVDLLIGLKFPAYLIPHPNRVMWIIHQHRTAYDLWDHQLGDLIYAPNGQQVRDAIRQADINSVSAARAVYANSRNVAGRLKRFCGLDSTPLYHPPPHAEKLYNKPAEDYLFFPSRLSLAKRQALVLEALGLSREPVRVRFAGAADEAGNAAALREMAAKLRVERRVEWLGHISDEEKREQYARSLGVIFPPVDEDYGYITLEAMLSAKPVISCSDSGGPLEFLKHEETGLIAEPTPENLAGALDRIWRDRSDAERWGRAGREHYDSLKLSWDNVVQTLLS